MTSHRDRFRQMAEEQMNSRESAERFAPPVQDVHRGENPRPQTFASDWEDIPAGTPHPLHGQQYGREQGMQQQAIDPNALLGLVSLLSGGKMQLPEQITQGISSPQPIYQLPAAPQPLGLPQSRTFEQTEQMPEVPASGESITVKTRRFRLPQLHTPEKVVGFAKHHKVITSIGATGLVCVAGFGGYRAVTGATIADAVATVRSDVLGVGDVKSLALPALDCATPIEKLKIDAQADLKWKANVVLATDLAKAQKDKKFKPPVVPTLHAEWQGLPAVAFARTPEEKEQAKQLVQRDLKIAYANEVTLVGCDPKKDAFRQDGSTVIVDKSKIDLTPILPIQNDKNAPEYFIDAHETAPPQIKTVDNKYVAAPGEIDRIKRAMAQNIGLHGQFQGEALDGIDAPESECKLEVRQNAQDFIETALKNAAKKQGMPGLNVDFINDFHMPGEVFRKGKPASLMTTKDAEIHNPEINCTNVTLVEGGAS